MNNTHKKMEICQKYAQNILTGKFETPLITPVRVQMTIFFFFNSKYIHFGNCQKVIDH